MFAQVRPSPWRQAVDLGNMMLVLAVRTDPDRVYQRALRYFTPAELAEAFAATRGVASPTQLRAFMKRDPRDLLGTFGALAPPREPIPLQRWSLRRVGLAFAVLAVTVIALAVSAQAFRPVGDIGADPPPCGTGHSMILAAQAVPSAALVPCVAALPSGWQVGGADIATGHSVFWLNSDQAGRPAVTVTLSATCDVSGARPVPSDQPGTRRFDRALSQHPQFAALRFYTFPGGCVTYRFNFAPGASPLLAIPVYGAVGFVPRSTLVDHIRNTEGLALCGRGRRVPGRRGAGPGRPGAGRGVTAAVLTLTAVVFVLAADHGVLARIQRLDDAWLRLMVSSRSAPVTAIAKFFNLLGLVYVTLPVRLAIAGFLALRRRWWHLAAFVSPWCSGGPDRHAEGELWPGPPAGFARGHQRGLVSLRAFHRRLGDRRRRGHRAGAARTRAGGVGSGRGGFLGPDGAVPRLPRRPLAVRCHRRGLARHLVRAAGRVRGGLAPAPP